MSSQLFFTVAFGTGAASGVALISGIKHWRSTGGKITAILSGLLLIVMAALVAFVAIAATILPGMIALP